MIHPTAIISPKAQLEKDVEVGAYTIIGENAKIEGGTKVGSHVLIDGYTTLGRNCQVFTGAIIGSPPQDLKYKKKKSYIKIGDNNIIREYSTINPGTGEEETTKIGNNNLIMAYSHIAHNSVLEDEVILANCATLAGHVYLEKSCVVGGLVAIHQFCRIGKYAIIGGCSKVTQDILPFSLADGHPARPYGINKVALKRHNFPSETIKTLKKAFFYLLGAKLNTSQAIKKIKEDLPSIPEIEYLLHFIASSERGIAK
ncbi:MAG: acyl-ACP--UDP-N-acetylglucosamine O-acyltransferase [Candidatus Omnitrophica bacterium]|nr:acyl-ACP--UDP-N-acetylglucosamine O-acyltransferase [Candidatus Omnitrophota bacterium]